MFAPFFGGFGRCEEIWEAGQDTAWRKVVGQSQIDFQRSSKVCPSRIWFSDSAWSNPTEKEQNVIESIHTLVSQRQVLLKTVDAFRCSILRVDSAKVPSTSSTHLFGVARWGSLTWWHDLFESVWAVTSGDSKCDSRCVSMFSFACSVPLSPISDSSSIPCAVCRVFSMIISILTFCVISSFMSLHFFLILSQKTSFKTAPQAWQVKNVKSPAQLTWRFTYHMPFKLPFRL